MVFPGGIFLSANLQNCSQLYSPKGIQSQISTVSSSNLFSLHQNQIPIKKNCDSINNLFLEAHTNIALSKLVNIEHVIAYLNGKVVLCQRSSKGKYAEIKSASSAAQKAPYQLIKSLSHVSVLIAILLESNFYSDLDNKREYLDRLSIYLEQLKISNNEKVKDYLPLINRSLCIIKQAQSCSSQEEISLLLNKYLQDLKHTHESIALQATQLQLASLNRIMSEWLAIKNIQLEKSRVLILGTHGPREDLIEQQYFESLYEKYGLKNPKNMHVIYVEVLPEHVANIKIEMLIENFLSKHELNKDIGEKMLADRKAMFKDVLGQYAPQVIKSLNESKEQPLNFSRCPYRF